VLGLARGGESKLPVPHQLDAPVWFDAKVFDGMSNAEKLESLHVVLSSHLERRLGANLTPSAAEALADGWTTDEGYQLLLVGLGRGLGIDVRYQIVVDGEPWSRSAPSVDQRRLEAVVDGGGQDQVDDEHARALYAVTRGAEALRQGDYEQAMRWLEPAVELAPGEAAAWINLGLSQQRLGRTRAAERSLRKALAIEADNARAASSLIALVLADGRLDQAVRIAASVGRSSTDAGFVLELGTIALDLGRAETAEILLKRSLELSPNDRTSQALALAQAQLQS
jgi:tetratricopeptide (TPR) repeat protein